MLLHIKIKLNQFLYAFGYSFIFFIFSRGSRRKKPADFWFFITADSPSNADLTFASLRD